jgi:hypothetical protein
MCLACAAVAFLGFAPTYFRPLAGGALKVNPSIHVHAVVFFTWSLFLVFQGWLVHSGQVMRHRAVGMIGISLATAMVIFGFLASINSMKAAAAIGMRDQGVGFAIVPLSGIAFFAVTFTLAIVAVRRPEAHRRLILLAAISILDAAVARWFIVLLAPPGAMGPPPVEVTLPPALVASLLLVVAMVHDWRTRGRPHAIYVAGFVALVTLKVLNLPLSQSAAWHRFAGGLLALAQ